MRLYTNRELKYAPYEKQRVETLQALNILNSTRDEKLNEFVASARDLFSTPIAALSLVDSDRQWFKSEIGLGIQHTPREIAFCSFTILSHRLAFVVNDTFEHPTFRANPLVTGAPFIRFYAGVSLVTPDNFAVGSLCVIDVKPRTVTRPEVQELKRLAKLTSAYLFAR